MLELTNYKFCGSDTSNLDFGLEKMEFIPCAGRNHQHTLCPVVTLIIAAGDGKMLIYRYNS